MTARRPRHVLGAGLVAALVSLALCRVGRAGTISPQLNTMLGTTPATQRLPVLFLVPLPVNDQGQPMSLEDAATGATQADRVASGVAFLKSVAQGTPTTLAGDLTTQGCAAAEVLWPVTGVYAECTPPVIRSAAARTDVANAGYAGAHALNASAVSPAADLHQTRTDVLRTASLPPGLTLSAIEGGSATIGVIDTGASLSDPLLAARVACKDTSQPCLNPYWYDAISFLPAPYDDNGKGTEMLQLAVGSDSPGGGMAPAAKWMACKALDSAATVRTDLYIYRCAKFMLDPDNPDSPTTTRPMHAPNVVLAPWWFTASNVCDDFHGFHMLVANMRALGILPVFAVGDGGGTVASPANYTEVLSVGGHDAAGTLLSSTSQGAGVCDAAYPTPTYGPDLASGTVASTSGLGLVPWQLVASVYAGTSPSFVTSLGTYAAGSKGSVYPPAGTLITVAEPVAAGSSIIVGVAIAASPIYGSTPMVGDARGNRYVLEASRTTTVGTRTLKTLLFAAHGVSALAAGDHINVYSGSAAVETVVSAAVYSGLAPTGTLLFTTTADGQGGGDISTGTAPPLNSPPNLVVAFAAGSPATADLSQTFGYAPTGEGMAVDQGQALSRDSAGTVVSATVLTQQYWVSQGEAYRPQVLAPSGAAGGTVVSGTGSEVAAAHVAGAATILRSVFPALDASVALPDRTYLWDSFLKRTAQRGPDNCTGAFPCTPCASSGLGCLDVFAATLLNPGVEFAGWDLTAIRQFGSGLVAGDPTPACIPIRLRNVGPQTWVPGSLALVPMHGTGTTFGVSDLDVPVPEVHPGDTVEFRPCAHAPAVPNDAPGYPFAWQVLYKGNGTSTYTGFVGPVAMRNLVVRGLWSAFVFPPQGLPAAPSLAHTYNLTVPTENRGTELWTHSAGVQLREYPIQPGEQADPSCPFSAGRWGTTSVDLATADSIESCDLTCPTDHSSCCTKQFVVPTALPGSPGRYAFRWALYKPGVGFFGAPLTDCINLHDPTRNAFGELSASVPAELRVGESKPMSITVRNNGTTVWNGGYCTNVPGWSVGGTTCVPAGHTIVPFPPSLCQTSDQAFPLTITGGSTTGRWPFAYNMTGGGETFGASPARTILVPQDHQASAEFSTSNAGTAASNFWTYRYYHWDPDPASMGWWKMNSYSTDHWRGPGDSGGNSRQTVYATRLDPGLTGAARFWKSPVAGKIRVSGVVTDFSASCPGGVGNGVHVRIRHHKDHDRTGVFLLSDTIVPPGGSLTFGPFEPTVDVNDTIRFIVKPRDGVCDGTNFDPLIQILEPQTGTGATPTPQAVVDYNVELED